MKQTKKPTQPNLFDDVVHLTMWIESETVGVEVHDTVATRVTNLVQKHRLPHDISSVRAHVVNSKTCDCGRRVVRVAIGLN